MARAKPAAAKPIQATVRIERVPVERLRAASYNPREMTAHARAGLTESLREFGVVEPIVWNRTTGNIVGGHQRVAVLREEGVLETDVVVVELDDVREKALNVALNADPLRGRWTDGVRELLVEIERAAPVLAERLLLPELDRDVAKLLGKRPSDLADAPAPKPAAKSSTRPGDVFVLGRHRLLCGDATKAEDVARVLDGATPLLMVTDPPYGVDYDGGASTARKRLKIAGDQSTAVLAPALSAAAGAMGDGAWYVWHAGREAEATHAAIRSAGFDVRSLIVWNKVNPHFGAAGAHYLQAHECCLYAVRGACRWRGVKERSVWDVPQPQRNELHPTQKPPEVMARPIRNHGRRGDGVYDPFVGSGTTLVAAEQLDRVCYAIDLDPCYVDVAVARWESLTGKKAERRRS